MIGAEGSAIICPPSTPPFGETPLEFCALASGSKGNAVYVGSEGRGVLVDAGLPGREILRRMEAAGLDARSVEAVVVTHAHRDHVSGVGVWARRFGVPAYATRATWEAAGRFLPPSALRGVELRSFEAGAAFEAGGLEFSPVGTEHDVDGSVGFRITDGAASVGFATDLGVTSGAVRESLSGVEVLYLESNHDEEMLRTGPYPAFLKRRIRSERGHLSNAQCAGLLDGLLHGGLEAIVLGHLSEVNNTPRHAYEAAFDVLCARGAAEEVTLLVARQDRPGRVVRSGRRAGARGQGPGTTDHRPRTGSP